MIVELYTVEKNNYNLPESIAMLNLDNIPDEGEFVQIQKLREKLNTKVIRREWEISCAKPTLKVNIYCEIL